MLFGECNRFLVGRVCFGAPSGSPVVGVGQIAPHYIILVIKLDAFLELGGSFRITPHLEESGSKIGESVPGGPNTQRALEKWNGVAIIALQNTDGAKIVITGKAIWHQGDYLREHGRSFFVTCMCHIEQSKTVVCRPIPWADGDGLLVKLLGLSETVKLSVSGREAIVGVVPSRIEFERPTILTGGLFVVARSAE